MHPMVFDTRPDVAEIDEEIWAHEQAILELRRKRNSKSCINQLPVELLARVFSETQSLRGQGESKSQYIRRFINFSHVCSHWRIVGIDSPFLWTTFHFLDRNWTDEMLKRSKTMPLSIRLGRSNDNHLSLMDNLIDHSERIQNLHLDLLDVYESAHKLCRPMPLLETLDLRIDPHFRYVRPATLPSPLFGESPLLGKVRLHNYEFDWRTAVASFRHVHNLSISFSMRPSRSSWTWPSILATLAELPELTYLELDCAFRHPTLVELVKSNDLNFTLPKLEELHLRDNFDLVAPMLAHMSAPCLQNTIIKCQAVNEPAITLEHAHSVASFANQHHGRISPSAEPSDMLSDGPLRPLHLTIGHDRFSLDTDNDGHRAVHIEFYSARPPRHDLVRALGQELRCFTIDTVTVSGYHPANLSFWIEALGLLPLSKICITNLDLRPFVEVLNATVPSPELRTGDLQPASSTGGVAQSLYWPTLCKIDISHAGFCRADHYIKWDSPCACLTHDFVSALQHRASHGSKLKELTLSHVHLGLEDARLLSDAADILKHDLIEGANDSPDLWNNNNLVTRSEWK